MARTSCAMVWHDDTTLCDCITWCDVTAVHMGFVCVCPLPDWLQDGTPPVHGKGDLAILISLDTSISPNTYATESEQPMWESRYKYDFHKRKDLHNDHITVMSPNPGSVITVLQACTTRKHTYATNICSCHFVWTGRHAWFLAWVCMKT